MSPSPRPPCAVLHSSPSSPLTLNADNVKVARRQSILLLKPALLDFVDHGVRDAGSGSRRKSWRCRWRSRGGCRRPRATKAAWRSCWRRRRGALLRRSRAEVRLRRRLLRRGRRDEHVGICWAVSYGREWRARDDLERDGDGSEVGVSGVGGVLGGFAARRGDEQVSWRVGRRRVVELTRA